MLDVQVGICAIEKKLRRFSTDQYLVRVQQRVCPGGRELDGAGVQVGEANSEQKVAVLRHGWRYQRNGSRLGPWVKPKVTALVRHLARQAGGAAGAGYRGLTWLEIQGSTISGER